MLAAVIKARMGNKTNEIKTRNHALPGKGNMSCMMARSSWVSQHDILGPCNNGKSYNIIIIIHNGRQIIPINDNYM